MGPRSFHKNMIALMAAHKQVLFVRNCRKKELYKYR